MAVKKTNPTSFIKRPTWQKYPLLQKGIKVVEHDLTNDPLSQEEILKLVTNKEGHMRGPIITQDDEVVVFGYNGDKLEKLFP
jgi:arsenate reductase-like glutaredoxin family protein